MVAKLRSILKIAPWSLVCKALTAALLWTYAPWWVFAVFACALFFVPFFKSLSMLPVFMVLLWLSLVMPNGFLWATFIAAAFFLMLGVKNLLLIKRIEMYELLVIALFFMVALWFFSNANSWNEGSRGFLAAAIPGITFLLLLGGLLRYVFTASGEEKNTKSSIRGRLCIAIAGGASLLIWESATALLFLPMPFTHQASLLFLPGALLTELAVDHAKGVLTRHKLLTTGSIFLIASVLILASVEW